MISWSESDETWFEIPLVWYLKITLILINLILATDDIIIWHCFGIKIWAWITLDLFVQMTLLILNTFLVTSSFGHVLFLTTWHKASLNIKRDFSFVLVPRHSYYYLCRVYLNSHIWLSILVIKILIFNQTCFAWNVSVNFRLNKYDSHKKIADCFGNYL